MKKRTIREGCMIVFIPKEETMRGMKWVVYSTAKCIYKCDIYGNIYSFSKDGKLLKKLTAEYKDRKWKRSPRVRIGAQHHRIDYLIAKAVFWPLTFDQNKVGHLDDNSNNNRVTNLFIDITPKDLNERREKE